MRDPVIEAYGWDYEDGMIHITIDQFDTVDQAEAWLETLDTPCKLYAVGAADITKAHQLIWGSR